MSREILLQEYIEQVLKNTTVSTVLYKYKGISYASILMLVQHCDVRAHLYDITSENMFCIVISHTCIYSNLLIKYLIFGRNKD